LEYYTFQKRKEATMHNYPKEHTVQRAWRLPVSLGDAPMSLGYTMHAYLCSCDEITYISDDDLYMLDTRCDNCGNTRFSKPETYEIEDFFEYGHFSYGANYIEPSFHLRSSFSCITVLYGLKIPESIDISSGEINYTYHSLCTLSIDLSGNLQEQGYSTSTMHHRAEAEKRLLKEAKRAFRGHLCTEVLHSVNRGDKLGSFS